MLMQELWALLNFAGRFGSSWRPCEQADAERAHIEYARELGIFLHEVFRCAPGQWGELLPLVEFVIWNSPGKSALAPRDLCMGWSLASPLERELLPLEPAKREAVSDVAAAQFEQFRRLREVRRTAWSTSTRLAAWPPARARELAPWQQARSGAAAPVRRKPRAVARSARPSTGARPAAGARTWHPSRRGSPA